MAMGASKMAAQPVITLPDPRFIHIYWTTGQHLKTTLPDGHGCPLLRADLGAALDPYLSWERKFARKEDVGSSRTPYCGEYE